MELKSRAKITDYLLIDLKNFDDDFLNETHIELETTFNINPNKSGGFDVEINEIKLLQFNMFYADDNTEVSQNLDYTIEHSWTSSTYTYYNHSIIDNITIDAKKNLMTVTYA